MFQACYIRVIFCFVALVSVAVDEERTAGAERGNEIDRLYIIINRECVYLIYYGFYS